MINVKPETPGLDAMLTRFNREHCHDEDEVRFIVDGRGLFHIHPDGPDGVHARGRGRRPDPGPARDAPLVRPLHGPAIRAVRLFQDTSGWTPHYTESGVDAGFSRSVSDRRTVSADV